MCRSRNRITRPGSLKEVINEDEELILEQRRQGFTVVMQIKDHQCPRNPEIIAVICAINADVEVNGHNAGYCCPLMSVTTESIMQAISEIYTAMLNDNLVPIATIITKNQIQFLSPEFREICRQLQAEHITMEFPDLITPETL